MSSYQSEAQKQLMRGISMKDDIDIKIDNKDVEKINEF